MRISFKNVLPDQAQHKQTVATSPRPYRCCPLTFLKDHSMPAKDKGTVSGMKYCTIKTEKDSIKKDKIFKKKNYCQEFFHSFNNIITAMQTK